MDSFRRRLLQLLLAISFAVISFQSTSAQSSATLQGSILDSQAGAVNGARVTVRSLATGQERTTESDAAGNFQVSALPPGNYRIEVQHEGFQTLIINSYTLDVSSTASRIFTLQVGTISQTLEVSSEAPVIESSTMTMGQVINEKTVQEIPLNGRHFVDLALLIPGTVTPPQTGFLTAPLRGQGSFAFNTAGQREDTINFMINGVNLNDMSQNQITFQPSINTVSEFRIDNSTYSAEFGRNSGAIVNIATRSGTNSFHGEAFEYVRNHFFDARNFFNPALAGSNPNPQSPFKRNQFGAALGGPISRDHTFFFASYEGLRQRQGLTINSQVLSPTERASAQTTGDAAIRKLLTLIPEANNGKFFVGSAVAPVNINQWTGDISHDINQKDRIHGYYAFQQDLRQEPTLQGNTITGFGDTRRSRRQVLTLNETHIFSPVIVNEVRLGFNRIHITFVPNALLNPLDFNINEGVNTNIGIPQIQITGIGLNFGGPRTFPQGRGDTTGVFSDTLSWQRGRHSLKFGGEVRRFYNNNFSLDPGRFIFTNVGSFISDRASQFTLAQGSGASRILQGAWGLFAMDSVKLRPNLTIELGLRYDWNGSPSEALNRFVTFDTKTAQLVQVAQPYATNNKNVEPRVGFAWDPFSNSKTMVRAGFAIQVDQPVTGAVTGETANPPFGLPISVVASAGAPPIQFINAASLQAASLSPVITDPNFKNPYVQSWNMNLERAVSSSIGVTVGYIGSKGTHLRLEQNINQGGQGPRPFSSVSSSSGIKPNATLTNIIRVSSASNSSYNALWVAANKRLSHGLQFNANYTYSHSIDYNSLSAQPGVTFVGGVSVQDSNNIRNDRGSSDFDVRHRFAINWLYELPFKGNRLKAGWQISAITQWQTGNPIFITSGSTPLCPDQPTPKSAGCGSDLTSLTGLSTVRPDVTGPIQKVGNPSRWFTNTVCNPVVTPAGAGSCPAGAAFTLPVNSAGVYHFGNLGRNSLIGPGFSNTDFSLLKNTKLTEKTNLQFRAEFFDIFNHPNFGQPGSVASPNSTSFGVITNTRFPTGDFGSARQIQLALKFIF